MKRSRIVFLLLSSLLVLPIMAGTLLRAADTREATAGDDSFYKYLSVFSEVLGLVRQAYVDEPDMTALMSGALDGTTDALDPFSIYVPADQVSGYLEAQTVGRRHSGLSLLKERGVAYVVAVEKGSPAGAAGVRVGDIVAKMDGRSTRLMPLWEVQESLARAPGTKVDLDLIRLGESVDAAFELKAFDPPPAALEAVDGATILHIPTFTPATVSGAGTAAQVRQALAPSNADSPASSRRPAALLVDLRGVSSGDPEAAYETAKLFAGGDLGVLADRKGEVRAYSGAEPPAWKGKLVVLVDRGTLGAAEVLATVLHQKAGAELVGERTFGHAGRQGAADLSSGGRLFFTDAFYTGPDKKPLNEALKPDLLVDERTRTYLEKDVPMSELILKRGIDRLTGRAATDGKVEAKKAA